MEREDKIEGENPPTKIRVVRDALDWEGRASTETGSVEIDSNGLDAEMIVKTIVKTGEFKILDRLPNLYTSIECLQSAFGPGRRFSEYDTVKTAASEYFPGFQYVAYKRNDATGAGRWIAADKDIIDEAGGHV